MSTVNVSDGKQPAEIDIEDFSNLIARMSRLLTGLARLKPFRHADVGIAEWLALTALTREDALSNKGLGRSLGVTRKRADQVCSSLVQDGLITVSQSAGDNQANVVKISEAGKAKIQVLNTELKSLLSDALHDKERSVAGASKKIKSVMRVLRAGRPDRPGNEERQAKRAARKAKAAE